MSNKLEASRFAIFKLSPSLPEYQPDNPDMTTLYELCDQLVETRIDDTVFGNGRPGPVTARLSRLYAQVTASEGTVVA